MNNLRKFRVHMARILLPFLTIWLCVLPAKSYAVAPLLVWGATAAVASGDAAAAFAATATAAEVGAFALQSLVGLSMAALMLGNNVGDSIRIPTTAANPIPAPIVLQALEATKERAFLWLKKWRKEFVSKPVKVEQIITQFCLVFDLS